MKISKTYLINVAIVFVALTLVHLLFKALLNFEGYPIFRLIISAIVAKVHPIYKPKNQE